MKKAGAVLLVLLAGLAGKTAWEGHRRKTCKERQKSRGDKYYEYFQLLNRWLTGKHEGKRISDFFEQEGIHRIAIYGMGDLANRLADELEGSGTEVAYGIDREACCTNCRIADVYSPEDPLPEVDAIVITPFLSAGGIEKSLRQKCPCRLIPLDQMIYSL